MTALVDSEKSIVEILQNFQGNSAAVKRPSTPQHEEDAFEFGSGSLVYSNGYKFNFVASNNSPTPRNVSGEKLNAEAEQNSEGLGVTDVASNDGYSHSGTEDVRVRDTRSWEKARRGGSSLSPTRSLSEDVHLNLVNGPPVIPPLPPDLEVLTHLPTDPQPHVRRLAYRDNS
ncbi:hypothetical protein VC83_07071 [Pseudogymnoascus destructans]|uniref:Uncharacterized protein n=1 Tax=Pseudogymnoascus destructans TaxID=655981 RepID=A0A177A3L4_9PEZI|nr:uncharacterized protein VC83_07071 [Pseudogymnoascus destructans]OAF56855.2 hypothetical protein VC83_07071 [Pseudogymnoascus destructans]